MSYREEYNKYVKRELNDSYIKDGRTITYRPHYHSFREWFDSIWIDTEKEIVKFIKQARYGINELHVSKIKWNDKAKEDWEMYCKYFNENNEYEKWSTGEYLKNFIYREVWSFAGNESHSSEKEIYELNKIHIESLLRDTKEEYEKYILGKYKDWNQFQEFLKQKEIIWSEDYKNDLKKFKFMKEFIAKYGRSEKVIIDYRDWYKLTYDQYKYIDESYINTIIIKDCSLHFIDTISKYFRNWKLKINYKNKKSYDDLSEIDNLVLTRK